MRIVPLACGGPRVMSLLLHAPWPATRLSLESQVQVFSSRRDESALPRYAYTTEMVSATMAGRSLPSTSMVI